MPGTKRARPGGRQTGTGAGGVTEPRRPLPSAPEPERRRSARGRPGPPKPALCRHPGWVGASCHPGRVPAQPRTEAPGLAAPGAHGHAVQTAVTSTARGAQGGHWGGTRWDGVGWGGDSGARGGRVGGTHWHRAQVPLATLHSQWDGDGGRASVGGSAPPGWSSPLPGQSCSAGCRRRGRRGGCPGCAVRACVIVW